ncbi:response regulator transcription factor [Albibacterium bauzanense]|uniref:DNA-binding response OmpR family regulator n=1 Tax=Albibacterium bauzanense TaxID=653929 RepID=A0A4R1M2V8_9SPHI|nr:response regulator transcription factor [Albibacterium bauzanense]TCK85380.1 DNA-binding response OmpR family regulator [Albibacterium bauzanense]
MKILIVEDERALSESIVAYMKQENYVCDTAFDYQEAKEKLALFDYDCVLLDIMLPNGNGIDLLEMLKKENKMDGIIIVSAKNSLEDRIFSLNVGADDYLSKPFHLAELSARVQSIIRRRQLGGSNVIHYKTITIDMLAKSVTVKGDLIEITRTELELLLFLLMNKGKVVSKSTIAEHLSGQSAMYFDNFDVIYTHIKNLKKKLGSSGEYLKTIYATGYKLEA